MKKLTTLLMCLCLLTVGLNAEPIDKSAATATAQAFFAKKGRKLAPDKMHKARRKAKSGTPATQEQAYYYVFNADDGQGFVIVSGDDRTAPIFGYADTGSFDEDNIPDNMKAWLKGYAEQMESMYARQSSATGTENESRVTEPSRHAVAPLVTCLWNQNAPYNNDCPTYLDTGKETMTGCVATAMAMLLYHHRAGNPAKLQADIPAYTSQRTPTEQSMTVAGVEAATSVLDWGNMLDRYGGTETEAQKRAVSSLMSYCGKSVKMQYGSLDLNGSLALSENIADALIKYFGFDGDTKLVQRSDYTIQSWKDLIYSELQSKRPVLYSGSSSGSGHAFIVDGYDGDDLFHFNWGWGGSCNGYYLLAVANPYSNSGIGATGTEDGYGIFQNAIVGAQPDDGATPEPQPELVQAYHLTAELNGETSIVKCTYKNNLKRDISVTCGLGYYNEDNKLVILKPWVFTPTTLPSEYIIPDVQFGLSASDFEGRQRGTYKIVPIARIEDDGVFRECFHNTLEYFIVEYDGTNVRATAMPVVDLQVTDIRSPYTFAMVDKNVQINAAITNNGGEYNALLYLWAKHQDEENAERVTHTGLAVPAGGQTIASFYFKPTKSGIFDLAISTDEEGQNVIANSTLTVYTLVEEPHLYGDWQKPMVLENSTASPAFGGNIYGTHIKGSVSLKNGEENPEKVFDSEIVIRLYRWGTEGGREGYWGADKQTVRATIPAGESVTIPFHFSDQKQTKYLISVEYLTGGQIDQYPEANSYSLVPGVEFSYPDGTVKAVAPTGSVTVPEGVAAVNISGVAASIDAVTPNGNPNTLYYVGDNETAPAGLERANIVKGSSAESIVLKSGYDLVVPFSFTAQDISYEMMPAVGSTGKGGWQTVALPFDVSTVTADGTPIDWFRSSSDTDKDFWLRQFIGLEGESTILFGNVDRMEANVPYIVAFPSDKWGARYNLVGKTISFNGQNAVVRSDGVIRVASSYANFEGTLVQDNIGEYGYTLNADGSAFVRGTAAINPFSAFFALKDKGEAPARLNIAFSDETPVPTGITSIDNSQLTIDNSQFTIHNSQLTIQNEAGAWYTLDGQRLRSKPTRKGIYIHNGTKVVMK